MAGVYKRKSDKDRGKAGKWTAWWMDRDGHKQSEAAFTDKGESLKLARKREADAALGVVVRRFSDSVGANIETFSKFHAGSSTEKHTKELKAKLDAVFAEAGIAFVSEIDVPLIQAALSDYCEEKSARTFNKTLGFVKAFVTWLKKMKRIEDYPEGLDEIRKMSEEEAEYDRRALTGEEEARLMVAAAMGSDYVVSRGPRTGNHKVQSVITGIDRLMVYRVALGTGLRADEIRSLTPERFQLGGAEPTITCLAAYTKNKKEAVQPITRVLARSIKTYLAGAEPGVPVFNLPAKTAKMMRVDLFEAGIPVNLNGQILDFHALRHTYITNLVAAGVNPKVVQILARHSSIELTMENYCRTQPGDLRRAMDKMEGK